MPAVDSSASRYGRSSRSHDIVATAIACAALLARLYLHIVSVVVGGSRFLRRFALANVANRRVQLAQRRRLGGARVQFAVDDGDILAGRLKVEKMRVRIVAAAQEEIGVAVVGVLQAGVPASVRESARFSTCALYGRLPVRMSCSMSMPASCRRSHASTRRVSSRRRPSLP